MHQQILRLRHARKPTPYPSLSQQRDSDTTDPLLVQQDSTTTKDITALADAHLTPPYSNTSTSLDKLNEDFLSSHGASAPHIFSYIRASRTIKTEGIEDAISRIDHALDDCPDMTFEEAIDAVELLKELQAPRERVTAFVDKACKRWPLAKTAIERSRGFEDAE